MPARPSRASATIIGICIIIGLVLAAIVAPVAATAAGQLVEISSVSGRKADVTRAEQLQVAEASPHQLVRGLTGVANSCAAVLAAPSTKAIVVKTVMIDFYAITGTSYYDATLVVGSSCTGPSITTIDVTAVGTEYLDFGAGIVVPAGSTLWARVNGAAAIVSAYGYKVPAAAAPTTTVEGEAQVLKQ